MAIGRISGALLFSDLDRQSTDLAFTTNGKPLAYMDFTNFRFGVNTNVLVDTFHVRGTANISSNTFIDGNLLANSTTLSTNTTTGALVVRGGAGIGGALYTGGIIDAAGNIVADSGVASTSTTTGALVVNGGAGISGALYTGGIIDAAGNIIADSGVASTSTTTGALVVNGGAGISGNVFAAGNVVLGSGTASNVVIAATTSSSSSTTGALVVRGGMGIAGSLISSGIISSSSIIQTSSNIQASATSSSGAVRVTGGMGINTGNLYIGGSGGNAIVSGSSIVPLTNNVGNIGSLTNYWSNIFVTTINSSALASTGNIAINTPTNAGLTTTTATAYVFNENATLVKIGSGGVTEFDNNTQAISTTTGAIQLIGGMSIASGNLYIAGSAGNAIITTGNINSISSINASANLTAANFTSNNGNVTATAFFGNLASANGNVNITPLNQTSLVVMNATSALQLPAGTAIQQPSAAAGAIRWNSDAGVIEYYDGSSWLSLINQIDYQAITPNGVSSIFTLDYSTTTEGIIVSINGTLQQPVAAYTVSGTQITFTEVPLSTDIISIRYIASGTVVSWSGGSVAADIVAASGSSSTGTSTGALVVVGGAGISGNLYAAGNVILGSGTNSNLVSAATTISTSSTTGALVVRGGVGIGGNVNIAGSGGNALVTTSNISAPIRPVTGSASAGTAPIRFTPGTLLATPESGAIEFAANIPYLTPFASARGVIPAVSFVCRTGTKTMNNDTLLQSIFGGGSGGLTTGALAVDASTTYFFEMQFSVTAMGGSSGNFGFSLVGAGTATFTSCQFMVTGDDSTPSGSGFVTSAQDGTFMQTTALTTNVLTASVATGAYCVVRGIFRIANAGTIIPSIQLTNAAAAEIGANSWFRCYPIGTDTVVSVGNWS